jgi:hypothetical protein
MTRILTCVAAGLILLAAAACQFTPTAPFKGFDGKGSRVEGHFDSTGSGEATRSALTTAATAGNTVGVQGIVVTIRERPSVTATVDSNGGFTLTGIPSGSFTIVFTRDGVTVGEISLQYVRKNQAVRITVVLISDEVVLVKEERDQVSFSGECPRGAGFWCQNQSGKNPNLSREEFLDFAEDAATLLKDIAALDTAEEVAAAVCNTGNQFQRQLASLALNLAAKTVARDTALINEGSTYATVGSVFDAAVAHLTGTTQLPQSQQQTLKDVMDRINNAQNIEGCDQLPDDEPDDEEEPVPPPTQPPASGSVTICHIPPGNYDKRHTITIDMSAWPAHQKHCSQGRCDTQGACN